MQIFSPFRRRGFCNAKRGLGRGGVLDAVIVVAGCDWRFCWKEEEEGRFAGVEGGGCGNADGERWVVSD